LSQPARITKAAEPRSLADIRAFVRERLALAQVHTAIADDVVLAVEEAAMNVITHGYRGLDPGSIIVDVDVTAAGIVVVLTDFGHAFEPCEPPAPDVERMLAGAPEQGFGLYLIHRVMDEVDYRSDPLGNHLTLIKRC
jgi:serine/threonine-protein kinase RsbW